MKKHWFVIRLDDCCDEMPSYSFAKKVGTAGKSKQFETYEDAELKAKHWASEYKNSIIGVYELIAIATAPVPAIEMTKIT